MLRAARNSARFGSTGAVAAADGSDDAPPVVAYDCCCNAAADGAGIVGGDASVAMPVFDDAGVRAGDDRADDDGRRRDAAARAR